MRADVVDAYQVCREETKNCEASASDDRSLQPHCPLPIAHCPLTDSFLASAPTMTYLVHRELICFRKLWNARSRATRKRVVTTLNVLCTSTIGLAIGALIETRYLPMGVTDCDCDCDCSCDCDCMDVPENFTRCNAGRSFTLSSYLNIPM
jgi:hypothetical protein